jgi:hypothetical protein
MDKMPLEPVVLLATVQAFVRDGTPDPNLKLAIDPHQIITHKATTLQLMQMKYPSLGEGP